MNYILIILGYNAPMRSSVDIEERMTDKVFYDPFTLKLERLLGKDKFCFFRDNDSLHGDRVKKNEQASRLFEKKSSDGIDFASLMNNHRILMLDYGMHHNQIEKELNQLLLGKDNTVLYRKVESAFRAAILFEELANDYLIVHQDAERFLSDQIMYGELLNEWGYNIDLTPLYKRAKQKTDPALSQSLRTGVREANPFRLLLVRTRRLFISMTAVLGNLGEYSPWVTTIDQYAAPFFMHLAWVFFMPRLFVNLYLMGKHLYGGDGKESTVSIWTRFRAQLSRRWVELSNDLGWFVSGIITCFVLTGALLPIGIYVAVAMQAYDLILVSFRAGYEITLLKQLIAEYEQMKQETLIENQQELQTHIDALNARLALECKSLGLGVFNFSVLFIAVLLTIPMMAAISPIIPLVGAALALIITIVTYTGTLYLDAERAKHFNARGKLVLSPSFKSSLASLNSFIITSTEEQNALLSPDNSSAQPTDEPGYSKGPK